VKTLNRHQAHVTIRKGTQNVSAASVIDLLSLAATQGTELVFTATGEEAEDALNAVAGLLGGMTEASAS
jgi:phosphocarrier protein HPr